MTNTVPTPATEQKPTKKRADQLEPGDWFTVPKRDVPAETLSAHLGVGLVLVVFRADGLAPETVRIPADERVQLLTPAEIEREKDAAYRFTIAEDLRRFADLTLSVDAIARRGYSLAMQTYLDTLDQVQAISKALDIEVQVDTAGRHSVFWPKGRESFEGGVRVEWFVYVKKEPEVAPAAKVPALAPGERGSYLAEDGKTRAATSAEAARLDAVDTGLDFSREPDAPTATPVPAGVDGRPVTGRTNGKAARR